MKEEKMLSISDDDPLSKIHVKKLRPGRNPASL